MNLFIIYIVIDDGLLVAKLLTKKQYNEYMRLCQQRDEGKILTPDGLHFICEANGYDPEKIGKHFLEVLPRVYQQPVISEETE